jgi:hypothetical protein
MYIIFAHSFIIKDSITIPSNKYNNINVYILMNINPSTVHITIASLSKLYLKLLNYIVNVLLFQFLTH